MFQIELSPSKDPTEAVNDTDISGGQTWNQQFVPREDTEPLSLQVILHRNYYQDDFRSVNIA